MTLPLELGGITDSAVRHAFEQIQQQFPISPVNGLGAMPTTSATLPTGTVNGQDFYYAISGGGVWHFKYNISSGKWDFAGGPPLYAAVETSQTTASLTFTDLATVGPSLTTPFAGDYHAAWGVQTSNNTAGAASVMGLSVAGTVATDDRAIIQFAAANEIASVGRESSFTGAAASTTVKGVYLVGGGTGTFARRWLTLVPVRVG